MFSALSHETMLRHARAAAKATNRNVYQTNYAGGGKTVLRKVDANTKYRTRLNTTSYAKQAGVTVGTARRHLLALCAAGLIQNDSSYRYPGQMISFRLSDADADRIGWELIRELRAEGLPWDDEWLAERAAQRQAGQQ